MARSRSSGPSGGEGGFTLPEVLIVIALMGILLAMASSSWFGVVESRAVDSATNQMVSDLRLAHTRSTNQLADWAVVQNLSSLSVAQGSVPSADYYLVRIPGPPAVIAAGDITGRDLPENTKIDATIFGVRFSPDGSVQPIGASGMTVSVGSDDGDVDAGPEHEIRLTPATSKVDIVS